MPNLPAKIKVLLILEKKTEVKFFPKCTVSHETRVSLKYFVNS